MTSTIPPGRLIGLSLSFCVRDIVQGKVDLDRVDHISTGTAIPHREAFIELMKTNYGVYYWSKYPELAQEVALKLWDTGKIDQPRLRGEPTLMSKHDGATWISAELPQQETPMSSTLNTDQLYEAAGDHAPGFAPVLIRAKDGTLHKAQLASGTEDFVVRLKSGGFVLLQDLDLSPSERKAITGEKAFVLDIVD